MKEGEGEWMERSQLGSETRKLRKCMSNEGVRKRVENMKTGGELKVWWTKWTFPTVVSNMTTWREQERDGEMTKPNKKIIMYMCRLTPKHYILFFANYFL